jgi:predicted translin family RNA/ssDNA-binding protein
MHKYSPDSFSQLSFINYARSNLFVNKMSLQLGIDQIDKMLRKKEEELDIVMLKNRIIVRACSNAIKSMHAYDLKVAKEYLSEAQKELKTISSFEGKFPNQLNHVLQEYAEAQIVLSAIEKKKIPTFSQLKINEISYLNGLLDAIGELKREMYVSLRRGERDEAKQYFSMMEQIYDELLPLRFSNSVLPEFRRKQDVGRMQIENSRGVLLEMDTITAKK